MSDVIYVASLLMSGAGIALGAVAIFRINRAFKRVAKLEEKE